MEVNTVLAELAHHPEEGALRFSGVRYLLIRPETLTALQRGMEERIGPVQAGEVLYAGGFTGGQLSGQKYRQDRRLTIREAVEFMCRMGGEIGWGDFHLVELDEGARRLVVEVGSSPFAEAYGHPSETGVCHLIRGVLGGLASGMFEADVHSTEPRCSAIGDDSCRFEIEPRE